MFDEVKSVIEGMHHYQVKFITKKRLSPGDVSIDRGRLMIPENSVVAEDFLDERHQQELDEHGFTRVKVLAPCLKDHSEVCLRKWVDGNRSSYVLNSGWTNILMAKTNQLEAGDLIQVLSLRVNNDHDPMNPELVIAIVKA